MKKITAVGLLAVQSFIVQGNEVKESVSNISVETESIRKENNALKAEVAALRAQLKNMETVAAEKEIIPQEHTSQTSSLANSQSNKEQQATLTSGMQTNVTHNITDDLRLSVGTKLWINKWEKYLPDAFNTAVYVSESDTTLTPIPTASIKYKDFFISGSYFSESNYQFKSNAIAFVGAPGITPGTLINIDTNATRREFDVSTGYFFHPNLAISIGYKDIRQKFQSDYTLNGPEAIPSQKSVLTYMGPFLGLIGAVPIGNGFGVYGNFAYGWLFAHTEYAGINNRNANYILLDSGISYTYNLKEITSVPINASAFAGYRYQAIDVDDIGASHSNASDYTKGFVTGINMTY